jgi:hypothetical protein
VGPIGPGGDQGSQGPQGPIGASPQGGQGGQGAKGTIPGSCTVNYQVWSTHAGNGSTSQYGTYPTDAVDFEKFFDARQSNSTLHSSGTASPSVVLDFIVYTTLTSNGIAVPNSGDYYAVMAFGTFYAKETGTYTFTAESDDSIDLFIGTTNVASFYGGRGTPALGTTTGTISLTAGTSYPFRARMQEYAGGDGMRVFWRKPSQIGSESWFQDCEELGTSPNPGPNGPQGDQGPTGGQGNQGPQGLQGPK